MLLMILSYNVSAKIALPDSICQPDDEKNICQIVMDGDKINVMINGTLIRQATIGGKDISMDEYKGILTKRNDCQNLRVTGAYNKKAFEIVDTYCEGFNSK